MCHFKEKKFDTMRSLCQRDGPIDPIYLYHNTIHPSHDPRTDLS